MVTNPFNFKHNNIQNFSLVVNGELVPPKPLYFDFQNNNKISTRGYNTLFKALGISNSGSGHLVSKEKFNNGYFILAFNLSADQNTKDSCTSTAQEGTIRIEFKLAEALENPITCLVYTEFDGNLEIDRSKNVFVTQ